MDVWQSPKDVSDASTSLKNVTKIIGNLQKSLQSCNTFISQKGQIQIGLTWDFYSIIKTLLRFVFLQIFFMKALKTFTKPFEVKKC